MNLNENVRLNHAGDKIWEVFGYKTKDDDDAEKTS